MYHHVTHAVLQLVLNMAFTVLIAWMYTLPKFSPHSSPVPNMKRVWAAMWSSVGLLWVRNIYRAGEAFGKWPGIAIRSSTCRTLHSVSIAAVVAHSPPALEGWFYALDTVPVILCCLIFCVMNYGLLLPPDDESLRAAMDGCVSRATAAIIPDSEHAEASAPLAAL